MAYSRCGKNSDIYAFCGDDKHWFIYYATKDGKPENTCCKSRQEFYDTLKKLNSDGYKIESYTFERLERELKADKDAL